MGFMDNVKGVLKKDAVSTPPPTDEGAAAESVVPVVEDPAPQQQRTHTVKSGEALGDIAQRYGVDYLEIARVNAIDNPDLIFPGQVFKIPHG
ncbi:LysM domain-containing protein [Nocardioides sp. InS609-2]|uniref:LysM peptidoglycan-binding domain-containing protein n=1 Tax=Nocardioides sp. InS609-2 TaxID=2760705 RepID=UPI0020C15BD8|nr:LysM domain-containing protein [Nocardioides sp. InS609-2]